MNDEVDSNLAATVAVETSEASEKHILLFYKFHPLDKNRGVVELYRTALETLCQALDLQGRILVGCNKHQSEGINGTLSGSPSAAQAFVKAMTRSTTISEEEKDFESVLVSFWKDCEEFYQKADCQPLIMEASEFKWSTCTKSELFPDLNIKIVKELIGTGGVLASIPLEDVQKGYLTPEEWHKRMAQLQQDEESKNDTVLIDCRNTKEWQIGHFPGAPDPATTTFSQFPTWVQHNVQHLENKKVLMYCTGGIRCEKASAFIRKQVPSVQEVRHLQGGIHKYLDKFGSSPEECLWKGKNFVFDGRGAHGAAAPTEQEVVVVGKCLYCSEPYDVFEPGCVCTVCREPILVCDRCRPLVREYHCHNHFRMRFCYFTDLSPYSKVELESQLQGLQEIMAEIAVGKKFKQKRKTLIKQCNKVSARITELSDIMDVQESKYMETKCRSCGEAGCSGTCWGFHGLKRKRILEVKMNETDIVSCSHSKNTKDNITTVQGNNSALKKRKMQERQSSIEELQDLNLASPPWEGRDPSTGIRIPAACIRELMTRVKGKWCQKSLLSVLQDEFPESAETEILQNVLESRLMRVNEKIISSVKEAETFILKNMDVIRRIVHWHEPPVHLPDPKISVKRKQLPRRVQEAFDLQGDGAIFVCDKPSTVPVHPAGPYLSNSLTIMVEAQEGLSPKSLIPCHRIDRVTSGVTLCCTNPKIAHVLQSRMEGGFVSKHYLAKVHGQFPCQKSEIQVEPTSIAQWNWDDDGQGIEVNAPIETVDPINGIRVITGSGKPSRSFFRFISYDADHHTSIVLSSPLTGRSHQLRVHLQWLGYSIVNDTQYGGTLDPSINLTTGMVQAEKYWKQQEGQMTKVRKGILETEVESARKICSFCQFGPEKAFSSSQLLRGGHEICLHAFCYRITFHTKQPTSKECIGKIDVRVQPPTWMPPAIDLTSLLPVEEPDDGFESGSGTDQTL